MRVIAGDMRGLTLKTIKGVETRPTTDKIKESIFNMIGPFFSGGNALDLYGGSGSLGIESLSRGVEKVIFVDKNKKAAEMIKQNLRTCRLDKRAEVFCNESTRALKALIKRQIRFTYIFLDPPYADQHLVNDLRIIDDYSLLDEDGIIVCEHGRDFELPEQVGRLQKVRQEHYGETIVVIYRYEEEH